jgi:hypothetical protein
MMRLSQLDSSQSSQNEAKLKGKAHQQYYKQIEPWLEKKSP